MPILLNEDDALKTACQGISVSDAKNPSRPVKVWFGMPDIEITDQIYPYMVIEMVDFSRDPSRQHSGFEPLGYQPDGYTGWPTNASGDVDVSKVQTETPISMNLTYQVTSYSRHPRHDRGISAAMLKKFPYQHGGLFIEADETYRRAYLTRTITRDRIDENKKRLFSKAFEIVVETELLTRELVTFEEVISNPTITVTAYTLTDLP